MPDPRAPPVAESRFVRFSHRRIPPARLLAPGTFQHPRVFAGRIQVERKILGVERLECVFDLTTNTGQNTDTTSIGYSPSNGRPTSLTSPYGATTNYTYVDGVSPTITATTNSHWRKTTMDGFFRTIETDIGTGTTTMSTTTTSFVPAGGAPLGKVYQTTRPYAPGNTPAYTTYSYDGQGRTTSIALADGSATTYSYAGNTVT